MCSNNNDSDLVRRDLGTPNLGRRPDRDQIGAGIFQVTSQAWALTGPSVILGYLVLTPAILATQSLTPLISQHHSVVNRAVSISTSLAL